MASGTRGPDAEPPELAALVRAGIAQMAVRPSTIDEVADDLEVPALYYARWREGIETALAVTSGDAIRRLLGSDDVSRSRGEGGFDDDALTVFMRQAGGHRILEAGEEVDLACKVESGRLAERFLNEYPFADAATKAEMKRRIRTGAQAKEDFIECNIRLVVNIAHRYKGRGVDLEDLVQEGCIGLNRAVDKFDWRRGYKFSTYATWWVRQSITRAIADKGRVVRLPVHYVEQVNRFRRARWALYQELRREPNDEEVALYLDVSPKTVAKLRARQRRAISLDVPVAGRSTSLGELIADSAAEAPDEIAARRMLKDALTEALDDLSDREKRVVRLRFGLEDGQYRTLEEVGREFGVTRERIRQIESKTLAKLRHPHRSQKLRGY